MTWRDSLIRSRIAQGTVMGFYGLGVQMLIQLVSVPLFSRYWGLEGYGFWLMLFTVPSLLAMADMGLTTAGANTMVAAVARGERDRAARILAGLRIITGLTSAVLLLLVTLFLVALLFGIFHLDSPFAQDSVWKSLAFLALYGVLALVNGVTLAGFRAIDAFAFSGAIYQTIVLVEAACAFVVLAVGGGPADVALAYLSGRAAGTVLLSLSLRKRAPWLGVSGMTMDWAEVRALLRPAAAAGILPAANAITYQGPLIAIGALVGPAAVPAFSVARTLTRTALQLIYRVNIASMPRFTVAHAQADRTRQNDLVLLNIAIIALLVIPAALSILMLGQPVIGIWTGGRVEAEWPLLLAMSAAMVFNALWLPISNLLLAINRHGSFSYAYFLSALGAVGLGLVLMRDSGVIGMAIAVLAMEAFMAAWVWREALRNAIIDYPGLSSGAWRIWPRLRRKL